MLQLKLQQSQQLHLRGFVTILVM